jgi:hypothetical protein
MKNEYRKFKANEGSVLCVTLVSSAILSIVLGSYLTLLKTHTVVVDRSQGWNTALSVAEAGVEEAMAHLNSGVGTNNLAVNTWTSLGGASVGKTNYLGTSYYVVSIQNTTSNPLITATGYVPPPGAGRTLTRTVQVSTRQQPAVGGSAAVIVKGTVNFGGNKIMVDSFDSSNPAYSTGGLYDPAKRRANGDIITTSLLTNAVSIGDSDVAGTIHTKPGVPIGVDTKTNQASYLVGDLGYMTNNVYGIQAGHALQDASYNFTDVSLPSVTWMPPVALKPQFKAGGVSYPYKLDNSMPWYFTDLSQSVYVTSPNTVVYVSGTLNMGSGTAIYIAPGASLTMYVAGASASIGGQGVINSSGVATSFTYYGLPSNTSLGFQGNAGFTGRIIAPQADVTLGGGGSTPYDYSGQLVANSLNLNGHYSIHYDEALGTLSGTNAAGIFTVASWNEL